MIDGSRNWELFGYDMRSVGRHWYAAWRDMLLGYDSPLRRRLDEAVSLEDESGSRCYQAGEPIADTAANCAAILLPDELVLSRVLRLPLAVEGDLDAVLALEVNANSPFSAEDTGFGWHLVSRDDSHLNVLLVIVSRSAAMAYLGKQFDLHDVNAREVWVEAEGHMVVVHGFGEKDREQRYRRRLVRASLMLAAILALILVMAGVSVAFKGAELSRIEALTQSTQDEAANASRMRAVVASANETISAANRLSRQYPNPHRELARLTALLEDQAFVERFSMNGIEIEIRGRGTEAAAMMQVLADQDEYAEVTAASPIRQVSDTGVELFHLKIRLAEEEQ